MICKVMEESKKDIESEYNTKNKASNVDNIKMSNTTTLNNFSVERILSENTKSNNHDAKSDFANQWTFPNKLVGVGRKRYLLDENVDIIQKRKCTEEGKHPRMISSLNSFINDNRSGAQQGKLIMC